jgi:hypothetical protein
VSVVTRAAATFNVRRKLPGARLTPLGLANRSNPIVVPDLSFTKA